jgi:hypothetical protein
MTIKQKKQLKEINEMEEKCKKRTQSTDILGSPLAVSKIFLEARSR